MTRRKFLAYAAKTAAASALVGYPLWEARDLRVNEFAIAVPRLPAGFDRMRVALLADMHLGPFIPGSFVKEAVDRTNALQPELILLGGDYVYRSAAYIPEVMKILGGLKAPLGVYAVPGNHDNRASRPLTSKELERNGIPEITNSGRWIERGGSSLRIAGLDDLWTGRPHLRSALGDAGPDDAALLLMHNPDFVEGLSDPRVVLALCGHTHGGQMNLPLIGSPIIPSAFGSKYAYGEVQGPSVPAFVTCGIGTVFPPMRINRPPEIAMLTLMKG